MARKEQRPPRRYYELTAGGRGIARDAVTRARACASRTPAVRAVRKRRLACAIAAATRSTHRLTSPRGWYRRRSATTGGANGAASSRPRRTRRRLAARLRRWSGTRSARSPMRSGSASAMSPTSTAIDDLRHGWRQLRQHAGFAITAVGILALSMAASVTAFSVVSQILLRPLPYPDADRIVTVWERQIATPGKLDVAPATSSTGARGRRVFAARGRRSLQLRLHRRRCPEVLKALNVTEASSTSLR